MLDSLADKITIITILSVLVIRGLVPGFIAIILLTREILILFGAVLLYARGNRKRVTPSHLGKISMFLLYITVGAKLLKIDHLDPLFFYIVFPLSIVSGFEYVVSRWNIVKK